MNVFQAARTVSAVEAAQKLGIPFKRTGERGWMCCVFHADRTPSMMLYPGNGGFYCFGCGAHGDAITLYRQVRGGTLFEAAKQICEDFDLSWEGDYTPVPRSRPRKADPRVLRARLTAFRDSRMGMLRLMKKDAQARMNRREEALNRGQIPFDEWWDDPEWADAKAQEVEAGEELARLTDMNFDELWAYYRQKKEEEYARKFGMERP